MGIGCWDGRAPRRWPVRQGYLRQVRRGKRDAAALPAGGWMGKRECKRRRETRARASESGVMEVGVSAEAAMGQIYRREEGWASGDARDSGRPGQLPLSQG